MVKPITKPAYQEFMSASAKDRDKIRQIFRFLQELHRVKSPPLIDTAQYEWKISYDAVPRFASVQRGDADSGFILKAARPAESHCPKPSIAIENWLKSGWEQIGVEPELYPRRKTPRANSSRASSISSGRMGSMANRSPSFHPMTCRASIAARSFFWAIVARATSRRSNRISKSSPPWTVCPRPC